MRTEAQRAKVRGRKNGQVRLSDEAVLDIRRRYAEGGVTQLDLALEYGVGNNTIGRLLRRETWTHLEEPA